MSEAIALVCKTCGRDFVMPEGKMLWPCPGCSTAHSRPRAEKRALADLRRAHQQRSDCDFVNAAANYQRVLNAHPDEAEALWGLALCKYGVEFVQDEKTGEHLPVIHFLNRRPFTEDPDCRQAMEKAGEADLPGYQKTAAYIARIQQEVLAAESQGREYDVFLCYKGSVPGAPDAVTREYQHALQLYTALREEGYSVFFAHMTLRRAAGANYEAQIFQALQSARVMLVFVSEPAYLNTPWVQSEWRRYLERVDAKDDCRLVPLLYDHCDPYNLPDAFQRRSIQGLAMDNVTALDDLRSILAECIPDDQPEPVRETVVVQQPAAPGIESLLRRATLFLEDGNWASADEYCEKVLDIDPECARAYVGKLMAAVKVRQQGMLKDAERPFDQNPNYAKAVRFADAELAKELKDAARIATEQHILAAKEAAYRKAEQAMAEARSEEAYKAAGKLFEIVSEYKDASERAAECIRKAEETRKEDIYRNAASRRDGARTEEEYKKAGQLFESVSGYKDASAQATQCALKAEETRKDTLYEKAERIKTHAWTVADYEEAIRAFKVISKWKDAEQEIEACRRVIEELHAKDRAQKEAEEQARQYWQRRRMMGKLLRVAAVVVPIAVILLVVFVILPGNKYNEAMAMMESGQYAEAAVAFGSLGEHADSEARYQECCYRLAERYLASGDTAYAAIWFGKAGQYRDAYDRSMNLWNQVAARDVIASSDGCAAGIRPNGTVVVVGDVGDMDVSGWRDIVDVAVADDAIFGLRSDGTVVCVGSLYYADKEVEFEKWEGIVAISAEGLTLYGLRMDGTVVTDGYLGSGDKRKVSKWEDVIAVEAGYACTMGLRADGTVVTISRRFNDKICSDWTDIVAVSAGGHYVGLCADGTVVAGGLYNDYDEQNVSGWRNIVDVVAAGNTTIGLRADGTVVAVGSYEDPITDAARSWRDITAIVSDGDLLLCLRSDGTVVTAGFNRNNAINVSNWRLKQIPRPTLPR